MITKISPVHSVANRDLQHRRRPSPGVFVSRIHLEVTVEPAPRSEDGSPQGRPPESIHTARQAKIAALKQALKNGAYDVSAEQITDKMLIATLVDILV